jgi:NADH-quinone oxidoreductase subunit J
MELFLFLCFSIISVVSAALVIWHPHPVKSALFLIITFFSMGGLYLLLQAEFIALMQVLVYAGAVMVLFLFVIMLLNLRPHDEEKAEMLRRARYAVPLVVVMLGCFLSAIYHPFARLGQSALQASQWAEAQESNIRAVGKVLFQEYLLPFEVTSVLLLVAVIGVIVLAKLEVK